MRPLRTHRPARPRHRRRRRAGDRRRRSRRRAAAAREYEGTVVSVNRDNRTFRLRDCERGTIRIKVNRNTRFERVSGLAGLSAGMRNIEATVRRSDGRWVALEVERSGGGGDHGGDDDGGRRPRRRRLTPPHGRPARSPGRRPRCRAGRP